MTEGRTHCRTSLGHSMLAIGSPAGWIAKDAGAPALAGSAAEDGVELTANLQRRTETDGTSSGTAGTSTTAPDWMRLVPQGSTFVAMGSRVNAQATNSPPAAAITAPADGATFTAPANITLDASASDSDGSVARVEFFANGSPIGVTTAPPHSMTWSGVTVGAYTLTAVATDEGGATATSAAVTISVTDPAVALPAGWSSQDLGSPALTGSASASSSSVFTVGAAGADVWGTADQFHFAYQVFTGDGEIVARIDSLTETDVWAKAGVMIRESLSAESRHAHALVSAARGVAFQRRPSTNGTSLHTGGAGARAPYWVRLIRRGTTIEAYQSPDGTTWSAIGSMTLALPATVYVGLAVTSHNTGARTTAVFSNVQVRALAPPPPPTADDIVIYAADVTTIAGAWIPTSDASAAAGITLTTMDRGAATITSPLAAPLDYFDVPFQAEANIPYRLWLRLRGENNSKYNESVWVQFSDALSADSTAIYRLGTTHALLVNLENCKNCGISGWGWQNRAYWVSGTGEIRFANGGTHTLRVQVREDGVALDQIVLSPATYFSSAPGAVRDDTTIVAKPSSPNQPPSVSITGPSAGVTFTAPATIDVTADATDADGIVARVDFFAGSTPIGSDTTSPFSVTWSNVAAGSYSVTARATDDTGGTGTSPAVSVAVNAPNQPPSVSITGPSAGVTFTAPATIDVTADATDADGIVARVDFFAGSTLIGSDTTSPFSVTWSNVAAGSYSVTARATDDTGGTGTSPAVAVAVNAPNQPPSVALTAPANGYTFAAPALVTLTASASDADGSVARVEFYAGTTLLGSDTTAPYALAWNAANAGTYVLTAVATDTAGARSTSVGVTVTANPTLAVFTASSDHNTLVTSYRLDIFGLGADPNTSTPVATLDLGKPAPANGDISVDITAWLQPLAPGNYVATVLAVGSGGAARSVGVTFTR